jgi:hypothetical protein
MKPEVKDLENLSVTHEEAEYFLISDFSTVSHEFFPKCFFNKNPLSKEFPPRDHALQMIFSVSLGRSCLKLHS